MPSAMPHLMLARRCDSVADALFFVGNLAPDSIADWGRKETLHLRNADDRAHALGQLASRTNPSKPFEEGILLHLFFDWKWDTGPLADYKNHYGDDWFRTYRAEIGALSAYLFHHCAWSNLIWDTMLAVRGSEYPERSDYLFTEVYDMIDRNRTWHRENADISPAFYSPDDILLLIGRVKNEYDIWRKTNGYVEH